MDKQELNTVKKKIPPSSHSPECLYVPKHWDRETKARWRRWVRDTIRKNAITILGKNGKLKKGLSFVSLTGKEMEETKWFLNNKPFFHPEQLIAVDWRFDTRRGEIDMDIARELGVPEENIYLDYPLKYSLRTIRVKHRVAIINADLTCTTSMESMRSEVGPLTESLKRCYEKVGECFLFCNTTSDMLNKPSIPREAKVVYDWLNTRQILEDYFSEPEYRNKNLLVKKWFRYNGTGSNTEMFCFGLHLNKGE